MTTIERVMTDVAAERRRQERLWGHEHDAALTAEEWLAILGRQVGHVCEQHYVDPTPDQENLRRELVQVAAVAQAWCSVLLPYEPSGEVTAQIAERVPQERKVSAALARTSTHLTRVLSEVGGLAAVALLVSVPNVVAERLVRVAACAVVWAELLPGEA